VNDTHLCGITFKKQEHHLPSKSVSLPEHNRPVISDDKACHLKLILTMICDVSSQGRGPYVAKTPLHLLLPKVSKKLAAIAAPACGSVPLPSSSTKTREFSLTLSITWLQMNTIDFTAATPLGIQYGVGPACFDKNQNASREDRPMSDCQCVQCLSSYMALTSV
jgi:hypothetical protein